MPRDLPMSDIKPQKYKDPRPAELFMPFHERCRTHDPDWVYSAARILSTPLSLLVYRCRPIEADNVPASGPVILAANHFSNYDHFLAGVWLRRQIRFMAKSQLFGNPVMNYIYSHGGSFPVRRGHADEEAFRTVEAILRRGGCMMIYCEGGRSRSGELGEPRPGVGRAALDTGAPVVPVAIHGSQGIRRWRRLVFPKVTIRYGEPLSFAAEPGASRERHAEVAGEIFGHVRAMYEELEREGRTSVIKRLRRERGPGRPRYS